MKGSEFDELAFFKAIQESDARALLIGRRALVVLGLPVLTADYDFWIHIDDVDVFNRAAGLFGLEPTRSPAEARRTGRYVLENDEHVDVLVARSVTTVDGKVVAFEEIWERRNPVTVGAGISLHLPSIDDLIDTKRFAARPRDVQDIRQLEALRQPED